MMTSIRASALALCAGLLLAAAAAPVRAADAMKSMPAMADCKSADGMMMKMAMPDRMAMKASGDADKDFGSMMMAHEKMMAALAKLEVKCGKSASMKAAAQKFLNYAPGSMEVFDTAIHSP